MKEQNRICNRNPVRIALILLALFTFATAVLLVILTRRPQQDDEPTVPRYRFYPVNEAEDIFSNEEYLALNRSVLYCSDPDGNGVTEEITDENRGEMDAQVRFLETFLRLVTEGDSEAYRACFRESLVTGKSVPLDFTQQMLYNMKISFVSEQEPVGEEVSRRLYRLDYYVHRNNGTFRSDMESDVTRPQFALVSERSDGTIQIENLYVQNNRIK